jgi:hypothetical protein
LPKTPCRIPFVILALLALGGTSGCAATFLYDRADRFANRWAGGYVELDESQQAVLDERLEALHLWHRREQLPAYADWLRVVALRLDDHAAVDPDEVRALGKDLAAFWRELGTAALPLLAELGARLEDRQVEDLIETLRDERRDEFEAADRRSASWHEQRRARSMARYLRRFTGSLTAAQRAAVEEWAAALEPTRAASFENRLGWIEELEAALARRASPEDLLVAAEVLFVAPANRWDTEYAELVERNAATTAAFLADFLNGLEDRQRERAITRLGRLADDFEQLSRAGG